jgi:parallel beta-helix repeat protein
VNRWLIALVVGGAAIWSGCASGVTGVAVNVHADSADVNGTIGTSTGGAVEHWVQYGPSTAYGSETEHKTTTLQKNETRGTFFSVTGLQRATTYHYRLCASDSQQGGGPGCGADRTFTTQSVDCGETITQDVRLTADLDCQSSLGSGGWTIGADGVDINLGGHAFIGFPTALGLRNTGYDDLTLRNGRMAGWFATAAIGDASRNSIRNLDGFRMSIGGGQDNEVRHSAVRLTVGGSANFVLADSTAAAGFGSQSAPAIVIEADGARVLYNEVQGSVLEPGIVLRGSNNVVRGNEVQQASKGGIFVESGDHNVVRDNALLNSQDEPGEEDPPAAGDGIFVGPLAVATLLVGNTASSNAGDGIDSRSASTRLRDNRADFNGDLGIDAVPGVTDLGGNRAFGNGNALQCRNVFCS